ncbi:hypothetical protein ACPRNU_22600 [Chromobacterium vaccinii]|uniref:hypothetical protein n=1 Tax=Chromobacterium vaccinii TaxID=1108595 RepID=UPI003C775D45
MKFMQHLQQLLAFHGQYKEVCAIIWCASAMTALLVSPLYQLGSIPLAVMLAFVATSLLQRYMLALRRRIETGVTSPEWQVESNAVVVGYITDAKYAALRHAVFLSPHIYIAQLFNLLSMLSRLLNQFLYEIPIMVFWLVIGWVFLDPASLLLATKALGTMTPSQLHSGAVSILTMLMPMMILLYLCLSLMLGRTFGFVNHFSRECNYRLCHALDVAYDINQPRLLRWHDTVLSVPNEMAGILPSSRRK